MLVSYIKGKYIAGLNIRFSENSIEWVPFTFWTFSENTNLCRTFMWRPAESNLLFRIHMIRLFGGVGGGGERSENRFFSLACFGPNTNAHVLQVKVLITVLLGLFVARLCKVEYHIRRLVTKLSTWLA